MMDDYYDHPSLLLLNSTLTLTPTFSKRTDVFKAAGGAAGKFGSNCNAKVPAFWWWNWVEEESKAKAKCSKVRRRCCKIWEVDEAAGAYLNTNSFVEFDDDRGVYQGQPEPPRGDFR